MATRSGARILVDQLLIQGVNHAFCVPGESYIGVLDALYDAREMIKLIVNRHESGAAFMADAYAKLTGQPGVAFVTRGPGATNASIGVHTAYQDSTPLVLFVGQVGNDFAEREAFQEIDYRRMFGPMTKWVAQIDDRRACARVRCACVPGRHQRPPGPGRARVARRHAIPPGRRRRRALPPAGTVGAVGHADRRAAPPARPGTAAARDRRWTRAGPTPRATT